MSGSTLYVSGLPRSRGRIYWTTPCLVYMSLYVGPNPRPIFTDGRQHAKSTGTPPPFLFALLPPSKKTSRFYPSFPPSFHA